jgi:hypothetical protein
MNGQQRAESGLAVLLKRNCRTTRFLVTRAAVAQSAFWRDSRPYFFEKTTFPVAQAHPSQRGERTLWHKTTHLQA